jgi:hypothetical protein
VDPGLKSNSKREKFVCKGTVSEMDLAFDDMYITQ